MALEAARRAGYEDVLVFGPAFLAGTWAREAGEMGMGLRYEAYSMLHKLRPADLAAYDFWIADEAHYLKSPTAARSNLFHTLLAACIPPYFVGLTGTPIKNRVNDFWALLAYCSLCPAPDVNGERLTRGYHSFSSHFCEVETVRIRSGAKVRKYGALRRDRVDELRALLKDKYIKYRIEDVLPELPPMTYKTVAVDCERVPDLYDAYKSYLAGGKITSAKAASACLKIPATVEYVKGLIDEGVGQLVIFSDHVEPATRLASALGGGLITGATHASERHEKAARFQLGQLKVICATIGAFSTGVTLTAASHVVFNDLSWTPADNEQAAARIRRIGQAKPCFAHMICGSEVDESIARVCKSKSTDARLM
jgi:SWI/SNF-related matrix-associated actin-dependent regulator 1 of chromatin subfamily A